MLFFVIATAQENERVKPLLAEDLKLDGLRRRYGNFPGTAEDFFFDFGESLGMVGEDESVEWDNGNMIIEGGEQLDLPDGVYQDGPNTIIEDGVYEGFGMDFAGLSVDDVGERLNKVYTGHSGGWGGSCTCADGTTYWVGDNHDFCGSLACFGYKAKPGKCNRFDGKWSRKKVVCGTRANNAIMKTTGGWGGKCTCPDGSVYWVADNHDFCGSLACFGGGKSGKCNRFDGKWSQRKVVCKPWNGRRLDGKNETLSISD